MMITFLLEDGHLIGKFQENKLLVMLQFHYYAAAKNGTPLSTTFGTLDYYRHLIKFY